MACLSVVGVLTWAFWSISIGQRFPDSRLITYDYTIHDAAVSSHRWCDHSGRLYNPQTKQPRIQQLNGHHRRLRFRGSLPRSNAKQRNVCNIPYSDMSHVQRLTMHEQSDLMEGHSLRRATRWKSSLYATRAIVIAVFSCRRHDY